MRIALITLLVLLVAAPAAMAGPRQVMTFEAPDELYDDGVRDQTLREIRSTGVTRVRALVYWRNFTAKPRSSKAPKFDLRDPGAYPADTWGLLDRLVADTDRLGIELQLTLTTPGPEWATKKRHDGVTRPSAKQYGRWVTAEARRVGDRVDRPSDVRVIAATNRDLDAEMMHGRFRKDLYFRLNVARIHLPPLRERRDDIPALVNFYVAQSCRRHARRVPRIADEALRYLVAYQWPGNIRELKNVVDVVFLNRPGEVIHVDDLPEDVRQRAGAPPNVVSERQRMIEALEAAHWNKSVAADRLRWSRMTLYRKLAKYNVASPPER